MLSFIQWHQLPALRIFVALRLLFTAFFGTASEGGSIFWTPGISKKSSKSSIADPKWHLRWWKNILHTGQFVVNSLILLPYQLGSHHISCANRVSLLKSFSPKFFSLPYFSDAKRTNNYFMNTLENEDICNLMMYQVELEEVVGSSFPFWCDFAYLPLTAKVWIFLADWRMSYRSRQPGEVSYLLSMKIMPLVRKEHWNASSGNRELIFNVKAVFFQKSSKSNEDSVENVPLFFRFGHRTFSRNLFSKQEATDFPTFCDGILEKSFRMSP